MNTNSSRSHPFGDPDLGRQFTWKKKKEGRSSSPSRFAEELDRVRQRRRLLSSRREDEQHPRRGEDDDDWLEKEEEFFSGQTRARSVLRLVAGRPEPIDEAAKGVLLIEQRAPLGSSFREGEKMIPVTPLKHPRDIMASLSKEELEGMAESARALARRKSPWREYFEALAVACDFKNESQAELAKTFEGKSREELIKAKKDVDAVCKTKNTDYWRRVSMECDYALAKVTVNTTFEDILKRQPPPVKSEEKPKVVAKVEEKKEEVKIDLRGEEMARRDAERGCNDDEDFFQDEVPIVTQPEWMKTSPTTPIKPQYVNRVRTAIEWNKYNQTHYTEDEPPPKSVMGYKFNIFYPNLKDRSKPPTYVLEKYDAKDEEDQADVCVIRFKSPSPPYADVAFKIRHQQWESGKKSGFRSVFERGVLQLHFNFKRWRYRR